MSKNLTRLKPVNSSSRGVVLINKKHLWQGGPCRSLTTRLKNTGGRNNYGRMTCRAKVSLYPKIYRHIDFKRNFEDEEAVVQNLQYDPNRTAFIALIKYESGKLAYILAPENLKEGDKVLSGRNCEILPGNCRQLKYMPVGTNVHNIELIPGVGGKIARSAGSFAVLSGKEMGYAILKMPSKELRKVPLECRASIGILSNGDKFNEVLGKAGRTFYRGKRPINRGTARNPVDHHNGGRGVGKVLASWNKNVIKGKKTRCLNKNSSKLIIKRRSS